MRSTSVVRWRTYWIVALSTATALSLLGAAITRWRFPARAGGRIGFGHAVLLHAPTWVAWVLTVPLLIVLAERFALTGERFWRNLAVHVIAWPVFHVVLSEVGMLLIAAISPQPVTIFSVSAVLRVDPVFSIVLYAAFLAIFNLLQQTQRLRDSASSEGEALRREAELATTLAQTRINALRLQLRPHFLYNSLNTVGALMVRDPSGARHVLSSLAELLRKVLRDENEPEWPLSEELSFLRDYTAIQKARFREMLCVEMNAEESTLGVRVPRMLLQPLVENAIQHGFPLDGALHVSISAQRQDGALELVVRDNGRGFDPSVEQRQGIGLGNTRARLAGLYGDDAHISMTNHRDGGAQVTVRIERIDAAA